MRVKYYKQFRKRKADAGFCSRCSIRQKAVGKNTCNSCLKYMAERQQRRQKAGLCSTCGRGKRKTRATCSLCLFKYRIFRLRRLGLPDAEIQKVKKALQSHKNVCDCCKRKNPGGRGEWAIDHNHHRQIFRGIICQWCNSALGHVHDDVKILKQLIYYLETRNA